MAFPRRFKQETWFMRLMSGDVELVTARALESAFACGLVDGRTPVRSAPSSVWTTLYEAAELDPPDRDSISSLAPTSMDSLLSDEEVSATYRVTERDLDPRAMRPRRAKAILAIGIMAAALAAAGMNLRGALPQRFAAATRMGVCAAGIAELHPLRHRKDPLTEGQVRRLHELDIRHRRSGFGLPGHASHIVSTSKHAFDPPPRLALPMGLKGDPLDGQL